MRQKGRISKDTTGDEPKPKPATAQRILPIFHYIKVLVSTELYGMGQCFWASYFMAENIQESVFNASWTLSGQAALNQNV